MTRIVIIGGGPGGYESALVAASLGAEVILVDRDGIGGACVLYDCVPSKTLIATSDRVSAFHAFKKLGLDVAADVVVDVPVVNARIKALAAKQSDDIDRRLARDGVRVIAGTARFGAEQSLRTRTIEVHDLAGELVETIDADIVLIATGGSPRELAGSPADDDRVLSWRQIYDLKELPEHLVVIGSGVTGAEFASSFCELGVPVSLVSSRDRVLPGEDADAADVIELVFTRRGGNLVKQARASAVRRVEDGIEVDLVDGRVVAGSHALICVGSVPNTSGLGLEHVGIELTDSGYIPVDRVSRTTAAGIYAAGDCTGVLLLASVAAMQGRIAMWHALGEAVTPLRLKTVAANVFTHPEIATVGIGAASVEAHIPVRTVTLPLASNARAKMSQQTEGFVKLYCREATGHVIGGVVVAPGASELILPIALAIQRRLTVNDVAATFAVYPSLSGSVTEAARRLMHHGDLDE
ncbi:MAG: NAD(P)H-quinone dehydrogenase [Pseudonocardiales bacterium]|nr:NAD(P)H-quinone dehydrogenase [Pseudonocardiales bacterium]